MDRDVYTRMARLEDHHWWFLARRSIINDVIARIIKPASGADILEAGCGTGGNLAMLKRFGTVRALEPDELARTMAADKCAVDIKEGFLPDTIPFADQDFDLIVALDVMEHVEQDEESLRELLARLRPGGAMLITVPALPSLWGHHDELHHHKRRYTRKSLEAVIKRAGGKIEKLSYFNTLLLPLIAGLRMVKKGLGMDKGNDEALPPSWLNNTLRAIFSSERHILKSGKLPIGVSLLAVIRLPA